MSDRDGAPKPMAEAEDDGGAATAAATLVGDGADEAGCPSPSSDNDRTSSSSSAAGADDAGAIVDERTDGEMPAQNSETDGTKKATPPAESDSSAVAGGADPRPSAGGENLVARAQRDAMEKYSAKNSLPAEATGGDDEKMPSRPKINSVGGGVRASDDATAAAGTTTPTSKPCSSRGNAYASRAARKMDEANERSRQIRGESGEYEGVGNGGRDNGVNGVGAVNTSVAAASLGAAARTAPAAAAGSSRLQREASKGRGAPPSPRVYRDEDDIGEPPVTDMNALRSASEGLVGDQSTAQDGDEVRPGAYEASGRAPGRLPAWGRRVSRAVRSSFSLNQSLTHSGTQQQRGASSLSSFGVNAGPQYEVPEAEAVAIDEEELEETIRKEIMESAAMAEVVVETEPAKWRVGLLPEGRRNKFVSAAVAAALVALLVGLSVGLTGRESTAAGASNLNERSAAGLADIIERGYLKCDSPGQSSASGQDRFYHDLCRAIAAAVFGDSDRVDFIDFSEVPWSSRFLLLSDSTVDVLSRGFTHTLERDVYYDIAARGFTFSVPYFYDGTSFSGDPFYVSCAENLDVSGNCSSLQVCVPTGATSVDFLEDLIPTSHLVEGVILDDRLKKLKDGKCNTLFGERLYISEEAVKDRGFEGSYTLGEKVFTFEPLALATREDDPLWSDVVNWVLRSLFAAEEQNVTQITASTFPETNMFAEGLNSLMFRNAIAAVGNYGELYERHLESILPRGRLNEINTGDSGLIVSHPFGTMTNDGQGPVEGGALELIQEREELKCGIVLQSVSAADGISSELYGLDLDFCHAIAAGATQSIGEDSVLVVTFRNAEEGFQALAKGEIDVLSGAGIDIEKDVHDAELGVGFSFSQPYFYESSGKGTRSLATQQDDPQWSDFVYWVVASTFDAEDKGTTQATSNEMPSIQLFGDDFQRLFRDVILAVGNYGEIYARNLNATIPRSGRNQLQRSPFGPQHFPLPFS